MKPIDIIKYIVWYATQHEIKLTTNRLVKFVYLADLYHSRIKGITLTGFPWRFIYYGPYCSEIGDTINEAAINNIICQETYESKYHEEKEYSLFSCSNSDAENIEESFHIGVIGQLQNVIKKFGEDTPQLLDYVYFDTEPMKDVKKGDLLDFSKTKMPENPKKLKIKKLSPETIKLVRLKVRKISEKLKNSRERLAKEKKDEEKYKDEVYYEFIKMMDGEDIEAGLKGVAKINTSKQ